jgi:hypothetical protein
MNSRRKNSILGVRVALCILRTQNYSDAIAREQRQVRSNVGVHRKFSVFNQEDFLHFRNRGVGVVRQRLDCPLLLGKELSIHRFIDHGRTSLGSGVGTPMLGAERRLVGAVPRLCKATHACSAAHKHRSGSPTLYRRLCSAGMPLDGL